MQFSNCGRRLYYIINKLTKIINIFYEFISITNISVIKRMYGISIFLNLINPYLYLRGYIFLLLNQLYLYPLTCNRLFYKNIASQNLWGCFGVVILYLIILFSACYQDIRLVISLNDSSIGILSEFMAFSQNLLFSIISLVLFLHS